MGSKPEKRICTVWLLQALFICSVAASTVTGILSFSTDFSTIYTFLLLQLFALATAAVHTVYRYRSWNFSIEDDHLYLEHGVLRKTYSMVPFVRIQHIDTQRSISNRVLGVSAIVVYTAGSRGADVAIPGLDPDQASNMQKKLRDNAVESEDSDGV